MMTRKMNGIERYQFIRIYVQLEVFHEREFTYERIFDFTRHTAALFRILALKFNLFIMDSRIAYFGDMLFCPYV